MKRIAAFFKATTMGGLFILLPVVVIFGLAAKTVMGVRSAAQAIMVKVTGSGTAADEFPLIFAVAIVVGVSFLLGMSMISRRGQRVGTWVERTLLFRLPGYGALRTILGGLANVEQEGVAKPGLLTLDPGIKCLVLVTEDHSDGWLTVFVPGSPNPSSGAVQIVAKDLVEPLAVGIPELGASLQQWGIGLRKALAKSGGHAPPAKPASGSRAAPPPPAGDP